MKFEYSLRNGTKLGIDDMIAIHTEYEAMCTGEYIQDIYSGGKMSDKIALTIGYEVRRRMDKCDYPDEEMTIDYVMGDVLHNICQWLKTSASNDTVALCRQHFKLCEDDDTGCCLTGIYEVLEWIYRNDSVEDEFERYFENEGNIC